jgi:hypothetical protein
MGVHSFVPVEPNAQSRNDLVERGFTRQPLRVDVEVSAHEEIMADRTSVARLDGICTILRHIFLSFHVDSGLILTLPF